MRPNVVMRTLVSATAIVGIATAAGLAGESASFAAPAPASNPAASSTAVVPLATNNLGLSTTQAKSWQSWLRAMGYNPGTIDGVLGHDSWMAAQKMLNDTDCKAGTPDGIVGTNTIKALQRYLNIFGYKLTVDGVAGTKTVAAFRAFNS
ncbi:peptidoglycan-binding protein [Streptomyces sp. NPDC056930]|uniref:peptidoglycan-binding domain-containing protein n=1 Tax=unclassified Streptomyces TaxID=2593676 RepID=UPI0036357D38